VIDTLILPIEGQIELALADWPEPICRFWPTKLPGNDNDWECSRLSVGKNRNSYYEVSALLVVHHWLADGDITAGVVIDQ